MTSPRKGSGVRSLGWVSIGSALWVALGASWLVLSVEEGMRGGRPVLGLVMAVAGLLMVVVAVTGMRRHQRRCDELASAQARLAEVEARLRRELFG